MSAEAFAARLLAEVHEESLASLLSDFWSQNDPDPDPSIITGLPRLDELIDHLQPRPVRSVLPTVDSDGPDVVSDDERLDDEPHRLIEQYDRRKPVILHVSNYFNLHSTATTALVHELIASSVLPTEVGGKNGIAVYIDCNESFQPTLLIELMTTHLSKLQQTEAEEITADDEVMSQDVCVEVSQNEDGLEDREVNATLEASAGAEVYEESEGGPEDNNSQEEKLRADELNPQEQMAELATQHVHVFDCDSSNSILSVLRQLPEYLTNVKLHRSGERLLRFVCIYGIDCFLWLEREAIEMARLEDGKPIANSSRSEPLSSQILKELKAVQARFECPLALYVTVNTPGPEDLNTEDVPRDEQSETSPLFNHYTHSALLTLQPFEKPHSSTIPRSFDGASSRKDNQAGVAYTREFEFKPYLGGASVLEHRTGVDQEALARLGLRVMLDEENQFAFDM